MSANYTATITVDADVRRAFDAINDVAGWWGPITGSTAAVGDEFVFVVPGVHYSGHRVTELIPDRRTSWLVTGSHLEYIADKQEWSGSTVTFDLAEAADEGRTTITFTHEGLTPDVECYEVCSDTWGSVVRVSLKEFIETGVGRPFAPEFPAARTAAVG